MPLSLIEVMIVGLSSLVLLCLVFLRLRHDVLVFFESTAVSLIRGIDIYFIKTAQGRTLAMHKYSMTCRRPGRVDHHLLTVVRLSRRGARVVAFLKNTF